MITHYEDLTVAAFLELDAVIRSDADEIDKQVAIVALLNDTTEETILALPLAEYTHLAGQTAFLTQPCTPQEPDGRPLTLGDLVLIPVTDFTKVNTAQYVDFQTFSRDFPATLPELLSIFLVPEGHAYGEGYDVADVQQAVRTMSWPAALGWSAFFFDSYLKSIADTLSSLASDPQTRDKAMQLRDTIQALMSSAGAGLLP